MESSDSAIRKGKYVGSVIGISIGLFIYFYFFKKIFLDYYIACNSSNFSFINGLIQTLFSFDNLLE
tara:strand:- start:369 stop:566 length:198 start_codon:yes stop_codon:yes gene_type:complete